MANFSAHPAGEVNSTTDGDQVTPVVAGLADGGYVVVWQSGSGAQAGVYAQIYDAQGNKSGSEITVFSDPNSTLASWTGYHVGGVTGLADGSFVVTASTVYVNPQSGDASALYAQRLSATGQAVGAPLLVQAGDNAEWAQGGPVFATPGGGYAVIEQRIDHPQPYSQVSEVVHLFDSSNAPVGTPFSIGGWAPSYYDVAETTSGNFVMAALSVGAGPTQLTWQTADANGTIEAGAQLSSTYGVTQYADPTVVALANGNAIVAWQLAQYDPNTGMLTSRTWQGQMIDASGHATGAVFDIGLDASAQTSVKFTALTGGGFIATWPQAPFGKGTDVELLGQSFDSSAHASGQVMHLAAIPNSDLVYHLPYGIAATSDGGFVFTADWNGGLTGYDVYQQKFDPAPPGTPGPYIDVSGTSGTTQIPSGNFTIGGDGGTEQIAFASAHTAWSITPTSQGMSLSGPEGVDLLVNVNRVRFADGTAVAFDVTGDAGEAYRLYQAAFDRAPDQAGLGFHINDLDHGVALWAVAQHFVDSPEFQSTYGALDDKQYITLLYQHVLHRDPEAAGLQHHLDELASGQSRADVLTHFSESPENQANVIGQIADGMWFVPLA